MTMRVMARSLYRAFLTLTGAALIATPVPVLAGGRTYTIVIKSMVFGPVPTSLRVGDAIEWINGDIFRHTATAADKSFDVDLAPDTRARTLLTKAGVVRFSCRYHPGMTGALRIAK
jgi:plastocyanin